MIQIFQFVAALWFAIAGIVLLTGRGRGATVKHRVPLGIICLLLAVLTFYLAS
jgi:hypothetical protein